MHTTRQWEIQNSMFRMPVHCFFLLLLLLLLLLLFFSAKKAKKNMVRVIESKII